MARDFNGTTDGLSGTVTAMDSGGWSIGCWYNADTTGEGELGTLIDVSDGARADGLTLRCAGFGLNLLGLSMAVGASSATDMFTQTATGKFVTGSWQCVVGASDGSNTAANSHIYTGDTAAVMGETTPNSTQNGTGSRLTGVTNALVGKETAGASTFDGRVAFAFAVPFQMTADEAERFRQGDLSVLYRDGTQPRFILPLDSPNNAIDLANQLTFTVTGATYAEQPPISANLTPAGMEDTFAIANVVVSGSMATETDTPNAGSALVVTTGTQATETDTPNAGTSLMVIAGVLATETDTANAGSALVGGGVLGSMATETDTANHGSYAISGIYYDERTLYIYPESRTMNIIE
jgi:hypothetical protein